MIQPRFNRGQIRRRIQEYAKRVDMAIVSRLTFIGETFIINARASGAYMDQTGNLRSSIGYIVQKDGKKRAGSAFEKYANGAEGQKSGAAFMKGLRAKYDTGYVLIVCAGMQYAASVESMGKDVLTASSTQAKKDLEQIFKNVREL